MPYFIDRRLNPKDKSLGNRQRFLRRARAQIREAVNRALKDRNVSDTLGGETITIPTKGIAEPRFRLSPTGGNRDRIFPGNKEFTAGDRLPKPPKGFRIQYCRKRRTRLTWFVATATEPISAGSTAPVLG